MQYLGKALRELSGRNAPKEESWGLAQLNALLGELKADDASEDDIVILATATQLPSTDLIYAAKRLIEVSAGLGNHQVREGITTASISSHPICLYPI